MRGLGFTFEIDAIAGTVRTMIDGLPADPVIEAETQRRAWWLLRNPEHGVVATATKDELLILAPDLAVDGTDEQLALLRDWLTDWLTHGSRRERDNVTELTITIEVRGDDWRKLSDRRLTVKSETIDDLADVAADMHLGELIQRTLREAAKEQSIAAGVVE